MNREKRGGARLEKNMTHSAGASGKEPEKEKGGARPGRRARLLLIVLATVAALILVGILIYKSWARLPDLPALPDPVTVTDPVTGEAAGSPNDSKRKKEFYTFLVVGRDTGGGGNTDTVMLCAYDVPNQKLAVMNIPRDTMVDARHPGKNKRINAVWNLGLYYAEKGSEKKGIEYVKEAVGDMTGIVPDFYAIVNWEAFGRLVDAIGGVDFEVPFEMKYNDPTQDLVIDQAAGYRHLTGRDAMQVVRWRHNNSYSVQYADADLGRIRTQQALMKEIVKKCLKIENVTKIKQFAQIFTEEVETDLALGNLVAFAERAIFGGLSMDNVVFTTVPVEGVYVGDASYVQAKPDELLGILNESFNPYVDDLNMEGLRILQYSSSKGYYIYAGTGTGTAPTYQDPKPAQASTKQTKPPKEETSPSPSASRDPESSPSREPSGAPDDAPASPEPTDEAASPQPTPEPAATPDRDPMDLGIPME